MDCHCRWIHKAQGHELCSADHALEGLTLRGGRGAGSAVAANSHRVGVEGIHSGDTVGQLDSHLFGLIVGADSVVGFNVWRFQDGLLSPQ